MIYEKDYDEFKRLIEEMCEMYGKHPTEGMVQMYFKALRGIGMHEIKRGIEGAIANERFMPAPVAIRESVTEIRRNSPPEPKRDCPQCAGYGFNNLYVRLDMAAMIKSKDSSLENTAYAIDQGWLIPITKDEFDAAKYPRAYSFAKRCEACK